MILPHQPMKMIRLLSSAQSLFKTRTSSLKTITSYHKHHGVLSTTHKYLLSEHYDPCGIVRLLSGVTTASGLRYSCILHGDRDHHGGIMVNLDTELPSECTSAQFKEILKDSMGSWRQHNVKAVWLQVSVNMSHLISVAADHGFIFHHAEHNHAVMCQWMVENAVNKLPRFATHQVGVAGCVVWENESKILVVRDKHSKVKLWKFPGGLSNLGEDIGDTAVREVYEETGVQTEFCGILSLRQQHNQPGAFGRSDIYVICHLTPLTFDINQCRTEIEACQWMDLEQLEDSANNSAVTLHIARLVRLGLENGFHEVDITSTEYKSVYSGKKFNLFNRHLKQGVIMTYQHSLT